MDEQFGVVLWTTDVPGLTAFLEKVAGVTADERHPGYASLRVNGSRLMIHADEAYRGHPWYSALTREGAARGIGAEIRFRVADVDRSYSAAIHAGGQVITPPYDDGAVRECQVMGPDGFLISLWHQ